MSLDYQKIVPTLEPSAFTQVPAEPSPADPQTQIGREVAHELNNILTIIQGYADRLVLKNGGNPALIRDLQLISDNSRRAVIVIRQARRPAPAPTPTVTA